MMNRTPSQASDATKLVDARATVAVRAERAFSLRLGGSCHTPLGAHGQLRPDGQLTLEGMVGSVDGQQLLRAELHGPASSPEALGERLGLAKKNGRLVVYRLVVPEEASRFNALLVRSAAPQPASSEPAQLVQPAVLVK